MKNKSCHLVLIVDRSGSMSSIANDMIGGFNTFIKTQKEVSGECIVSFYQFDDIYETVFERIDINNVKDLDSKTYVPRGMTSLYDAIGNTVNNYGKYLSELKEEERPERVLVVIITDGQNNMSRMFTVDQVRDMIKHQTDVYNWDFVFLGSNIDAWDAGNSIGVSSGSTLQFANLSGSVSAGFSSLSDNSTIYRSATSKVKFNFCSSDYSEQDKYLSGDLKDKNKKQQKT